MDSKAKRKLRHKAVQKLRAKTEDDDRRESWLKNILKEYKRQIRHYCDREPNLSTEMPRGIRIPNPSKFIGSNDVKEFDTWMISLLRWIVLTRLVGPTNDDQRVQVVGSYLEGKALRWYNDEVTGLHCAKRTWTFEEVILGLFTRFVQATTMHVAVEKFEATTYDPKKGVQAYMAELQRWGLRMTQPPNSYTFRKKFLDGLPTTIIAKMIERGASPDMASLRRMVRVVQRVEDNKALMDYYVSSSRKTQPTESAYFTKRVKIERRSGGDRPPQ